MANELEVAAKEAFWRDHFERQREGGESITSYCREHQLPQSSFYGWRQKLGKRVAMHDPQGSRGLPGRCQTSTLPRKSPVRATPSGNDVLPKSQIGGAFTYTLNQWKALCRYTEDGALSIDNNLAERMVKLPALLRKNALFVGSETGGHRAAILLRVIDSAKIYQVEPWAWLNAVFKELPLRLASATATGPPDLSDLLPDNWLRSHPQHRWEIDEIRK